MPSTFSGSFNQIGTVDSIINIDADLQAIADLSGTSGYAKKTSANTWTLDTSTYLTANQTIAVTGDATGSGTISIPLTLATVPVAKGGTGATDTTTARGNLGLAIGLDVQAYSATLAAVVAGTYTGSTSITTLGTITSGTWSGTAVAVASGGTGATVTSTARSNLGLAIGLDVQAYSATLAAVVAGTYTGSTSITTLGTITSGTWGGTKIAVASGGTNATDTTTARSNLGLVIGTNVQAWDADLDSIAGQAGTSGFAKKTSANTWTLDTSTYLTTNQSISVSGDATGSGTTSIALTLASVGTAGTYQSVTTDAKGRVTAGTNPTTLSGFGITDAQPLDGDLTAIAALGFTSSSLIRKTAANTYSLDTATYLTGNQTVTLSGDATGSGATSIAVTLANTTVTAGSYTTANITVDAKGRVTAAASSGLSLRLSMLLGGM